MDSTLKISWAGRVHRRFPEGLLQHWCWTFPRPAERQVNDFTTSWSMTLCKMKQDLKDLCLSENVTETTEREGHLFKSSFFNAQNFLPGAFFNTGSGMASESAEPVCATLPTEVDAESECPEKYAIRRPGHGSLPSGIYSSIVQSLWVKKIPKLWFLTAPKRVWTWKPQEHRDEVFPSE